jgi:hypothetical protein
MQYLQHSSNPDGIKMITTDEERAMNQRKLDYIDNGSPTSAFVNNIGSQAIRALGSQTGPNMHYGSHYMQGQEMHDYMPRINFDLAPLLGGGGMNPGGQRGPQAPVGQPGPTSEPPSPWGIHGDPFGSIGAPSGSPRDPFANLPTSLGPGGESNRTNMNDVFGRGVQYLRDHPSLAANLIKGGSAALFTAIGAGPLLGTALGAKLAEAFANYQDRQVVGTQTQRPTDILTPGFGPGDYATGLGGTPTPQREHISPSFPAQRNSDWINNFWNNLQNGGGQRLGVPSGNSNSRRGRGLI